MVTVPSKWLLAIDTASDQAMLGLTNGSITSETSWHTGRNQTVSVPAEIDHLLELQGVAPQDLAAIGISMGPGTFNGVRVGLSIAKGFYLALNIPLIGISALEVTAFPFKQTGESVIPVVAAGRERLVWMSLGTEPVNGTIDELALEAASSERPVTIAGDLQPEQAARLAAISGVNVPPVSVRRRRGSVLAELVWARYRIGSFDDPATLSPVYIHGSAVRIQN